LNLGLKLSSALQIERECYEDSWNEKDFRHCLGQKNVATMSAEVDGKLAGYVIYEKRKGKFSIINLAVSPEFQRRGVARGLLDIVKSWLKTGDILDVTAAESMTTAHLFFKSQGFRAEKVEREFFEVGNSYEDGYLFVHKCPARSMTPDEFEQLVFGKKKHAVD